MDPSIADLAWLQFDAFKEEKNIKSDSGAIVCTQCLGSDIVLHSNERICSDCGLVLASYLNTSSVSFDAVVQPTFHRPNNSARSNKIKKMQNWYMWSNEEKNAYKLGTYTKDLCTKLDINEDFQQVIADTVIEVMTIIRKHDGTKRARVKDGIILCCIQYVSKSIKHEMSACDLAKRLHMDIKYVTKAEKIILELINNKKLHLDKGSILETKQPFSYVMDVVRRKCLRISEDILKEISTLIHFCQENDILLDHTPLSIGVCCFYYVLKANNIPIDMKVFSELYDLSVVTVIKTYNKLKAIIPQLK